MNDPDGLLFPHLRKIQPDLARLFETVFVTVPLKTQRQHPQEMEWLKSEPLFEAIFHDRELTVGEDFLTLYGAAARGAVPGQIIHICYIDRVAYALQSECRREFIADLMTLEPRETPIIFERSADAWRTHPDNYWALESMVSTAADHLFGRALDYTWCHIAMQPETLLEILPTVTRRDMAHVAEYILPIRDTVNTRAVDWLAWEDPFILGRDPEELKQEREESIGETHKRLSYVIPILQMFNEVSNGRDEATW
jgi:hypothetical protein